MSVRVWRAERPGSASAAGVAPRAILRAPDHVPNRRRSVAATAALGVALAASAAALLGWTRTTAGAVQRAPSITITDVRPLHTQDAALRDLITHTFAVRVTIRGWTLLPYRPGATAKDNRPRAGHWRLYLDGRSLGDSYGTSRIFYTPYLTPGSHWVAAELSDADSTSLEPAVWSEPVVLHVPRVVRCWQAGWRGTPKTGTPRFSCDRSQDRTTLDGQ